jgi:hypothetical protein
MKSMPPFKVYGFVLLLVCMIFSACRGGGGRATAPPPTTVLVVGAPVSDTVVRSTFNAYSATVTPGSFYKVSITAPTDDVDLNVYDTDSTFTNPIRCPIDNASLIASVVGELNEDCILIPSGNTLFFGVNGSALAGSAAVYTIDVELLPEATLSLSIPFGDQTTQRGAGVFSVPVSPGDYTVSITGLTDDADLHVFTEVFSGNGSVISSVCSAATSTNNTLIAGTPPEDCTLNVSTSSTDVLFVVDGIFSSASTVQYTALVTPAPHVLNPTNEGPVASPSVITAGTPSIGQVGLAGTSRYEVNNLTAGSRYTISITGLTDAADLAVFGTDNTFTNRAPCLIDNISLAGTTPESCTLQAPQGGTVFFEVLSGATAVNGASYIILVEPGP